MLYKLQYRYTKNQLCVHGICIADDWAVQLQGERRRSPVWYVRSKHHNVQQQCNPWMLSWVILNLELKLSAWLYLSFARDEGITVVCCFDVLLVYELYVVSVFLTWDINTSGWCIQAYEYLEWCMFCWHESDLFLSFFSSSACNHAACECNPEGSLSANCDNVTGVCDCISNVVNDKCDACAVSVRAQARVCCKNHWTNLQLVKIAWRLQYPANRLLFLLLFREGKHHVIMLNAYQYWSSLNEISLLLPSILCLLACSNVSIRFLAASPATV